MKQYIILHNDGIIGLENEVNEKIEEGYLPFGDMTISTHGDLHTGNPIFCQPMFYSEPIGCQCEGCQCKE